MARAARERLGPWLHRRRPIATRAAPALAAFVAFAAAAALDAPCRRSRIPRTSISRISRQISRQISRISRGGARRPAHLHGLGLGSGSGLG